jgi:uncharacterized protein (DUF1697 family)
MTENYIAILRGINVSGQKKVNMAELRLLLSNLGLQDLETYIQSGNIVFKADQKVDELAATIKERILNHFGFEVPTLILHADEMDKVIQENPFQHKDLSKVYVTFLSFQPNDHLIESLPPSPNSNECYLVKGKAIYVYCPDGYGRTKINNMFFERKLKTTATTRNWKTCMKLWEMAKRKI